MDETQKISLPNEFVERIRRVIPAGDDLLLDSAIRRNQLSYVLQRLHAHKDVRRPATTWEQLAIELIFLSVNPGHRCSEQAAALMREVARKAEVTRLYEELHTFLHPKQHR